MSHTPMTPVQALNLLGQAAATFVGTRADHDKLEQAFKVLEPLVAPPAPPALAPEPAAHAVAPVASGASTAPGAPAEAPALH